jgi:hypothetical protein
VGQVGGVVPGDPAAAAVQVVGLALAATVVAVVVAAVYRWYARFAMPGGLSVLVGVSVVALYLNSRGALATVIGGDTRLLSVETAALNVVVFGVAVVAAVTGRGLGDRLGSGVLEATGERALGTDVSTIVRTAGRVTTVTLPDADDIQDLEAYDPVDPAVRTKLAGETLRFPRRLTVEALEERLEKRLRTDYGVGHVDVEFDTDGDVRYIAVGSRESGLGPTLPPESAAVAVRADPAFAASAGDVVHVHRPGPDGERVAVAELRGVADDVVTLAIDEADAADLDGTTRYRLVTQPVEPRPDREFASVLRAADETMGVVTVGAESGLVGLPVGAVSAAVAAVRPADGPVEAIPSRGRPLAVGDTLYAVARPGVLARLASAAEGGGDGDDGTR